jgi:hypothetical protein
MQFDNVVRFYAHWESEEKEDEDPGRHRGSVWYSTYEIPYLMAGRLTAFAGIATSEVVLRNEKKERFLRKASFKWSRRTTTGGTITSTGV